MSDLPPPYPGSVDPAYPPKVPGGPTENPPAGYQPPPPGYQPPAAGYPAPPGYPAPQGGPPPGPSPMGVPYPGCGYAQPGYPQGPPGPTQYSQPPTQYSTPASYGQGQTVVMQPAPVVTCTTLVQQFRDHPVQTTCPSCQAQVMTALTHEMGTFTWLLCAIICLVGCDLGCCLIPFCVDGCKDVVHSCPNCMHVLSRWNRL